MAPPPDEREFLTVPGTRKFCVLSLLMLASVLMTGCFSSQPAGSGPAYANGPPGYTSQPAEAGPPVTAPPPAVSQIDSDVARSVRRTLKQDRGLAGVASHVRVAVDNGV